MSQIVLNNEGQSDSSTTNRTFTATAASETFFMINNSDGVVTFNISNSPTYAPKSKYHSINSNGGIILQPAGYMKFTSSAAGAHVVSGVRARHGTSSHRGETLCLVENS